MNTTENNRLIAEFMNLDTYPPHDDYPLLYDCSPIDQDPQWYALEEFQYHTSWDWLRSVVEKIEDYLSDNIGVVGYFDECLSSNDLDTRYQAVVEFIKQHNN